MNKSTLIVSLLVSLVAGVVIGITAIRSNNAELGQVIPSDLEIGISEFIHIREGCTYVWRGTAFVCARNGKRITLKEVNEIIRRHGVKGI